MINGYALIAINKDGSKSMCREHQVFDVRLQDLELYHIEDELTPNELKDCLVMVFFKYESVRSGGWEYVEYEDCLIPVSHTVIQNNYRDFWREQISIQVTCHGYKDFPSVETTKDDEKWADEMIEEWESLYDEDFEVHPRWKKENKEDREDEINAKLLMDIFN